jgi:glucosamine--fructose-6-phosphate aminotransferase (isomerizing)
VAHLIHHYFKSTRDLFEATRKAAADLRGAYALGVVALADPETMTGARMGCPLVVGLGEGENFLASDVSAVISETRKVLYLEDGDVVALKRGGVRVVDAAGREVKREVHLSELTADAVDLGPYRHYMQKEIHEQPRAVADTLEGVIDAGVAVDDLFGDGASQAFANIDSILVLASGTSFYAGSVARYWFEGVAKIPCSVELGHEYRYRDSIPNPRQLVVTISQSGETLDTMEALKRAKELGHAATLSICNVRESAIPRASRFVFYTRAGAEIGVASTKAFTTQLAALFTLCLALAKVKGRLDAQAEADAIEQLRYVPGSIQHALNLEPQIQAWAERFAQREHALFLGRGIHYPVALEGALKLKEISYIHAEAYPAGELKHGPLALVDAQMPVVVIAPNDALLEKVKSNMQEVRARGGELYVFADLDSHFSESEGVHVIRTPRHSGLLSPIVHAVPVQLLAYHTALKRGTDVDKPRNLAKAVTVE